jgi:prepilin-type N-terminal cleavage/methylation domain-containing protein
MNASRRLGFTLIELLTVIAIIAILAGMIFTVGPGMIRRAKERRLDGALRQVNTALVSYMADNKRGSYPPAYGYIGENQGKNDPPADPALDETYYHLRPYMMLLGHHGELGFYDEFSTSYDTNGDGRLSLLEFMPAGIKTPTGTYQFTPRLPRYNGSNDGDEVGLQLGAKQRPFIYIPVNRSQAKRAATFWINNKDFLAKTWNPAAPEVQGMAFPPSKYDAFVLIGVGSFNNTFGLVDDPPFLAQVAQKNAYHLAALRAYFLATRDLNANGKLDFDYNARTREGEGKLEYTVKGAACNNQLPCNMPNGAGPWIYVSQ